MTTATSDIGLYRDASVYDILHAPGTAAELDALERVFLRHWRGRAASPVWLEPACGSGRLLRLAARRGTRAVGFDADAGMVAYANAALGRRGLAHRARVHAGDMTEFVPGVVGRASADFAFCTINSFRHLMSDAEAFRHLRQIGEALRPGGLYAVGLSTACYALDGPTEDVWEAARGACRVRQVVEYDPPTGRRGGTRVERVYSHLMITRPGGVEHRDSSYGLRTYDLDQWLGLVERSPLRLTGVADAWGDEAVAADATYRLYVLARD